MNNMKITLSVATSTTSDNGTDKAGYSQKLDTEVLEMDDLQKKFIEAIKGCIDKVKEAGYDLKIASEKLDKFFD